VNHLEHCDALEVEIDRFATVLEGANDATMVPSCPEWSVNQLAEHLGHVHRWAEHLVRVRATQRVPSKEMDFARGPVNAPWIRSGGASLLATLRSGNPEESMWAWGVDQHLRFWSRRQLHETFVHRLDLELAVGRAPVVDPLVASDAIDEFLVNLESAGDFSPDVREIRGGNELIQITVTDVAGLWTIELMDSGFRLIDSTSTPHVELSGPAKELLMVLYRRQAIVDVNVTVKGDRTLIDYWLANSAFE
jgi:uncharacterized protein (TIGR03083 family)